MKTIQRDIAVLGAGPARLSVAVEASASGRKVALFKKSGKVD